MRNLPQLVSAVQHNCDVSDARFAGDYGLCTFLLKMREYYRWENELPFSRALPKNELGEWLASREKHWDAIESEAFHRLPLGLGDADPLAADAANRELLARGLVYGAGFGRYLKPVFFLGKLLRIEQCGDFTVLVSSCEYARELAAPPAMLQGRTIYLRQESVRRYLWEKIEEWQWRKQGGAMARALAGCGFAADPDAALARLAEHASEAMVRHELGEAMAGELLGDAWTELSNAVARTRHEAPVRAIRDLLADSLSTLPALLQSANLPALHVYFATYDSPRRELFPQALEAYADLVQGGAADSLWRAAREGQERWLATARHLAALGAEAREKALDALNPPGPTRPAAPDANESARVTRYVAGAGASTV